MTPATGPWVSPMKNSAPSLQQQTGQTLAQVGETAARLGNTIGDRVQDTMNDAVTKAAENQFLQSSLPVLGKYRTTEGLNATSQFDPTAQAIAKARQDARATLTNPIQQRMFDQVTNDHMVTFGSQMADHENVQRVQYGKNEASARADSLNVLARMAHLNGDMQGAAKYSVQADAETLHVAQLSGASPDSEVAQAMLRTKRGELARGVMAGLLERHALSEADDYFSKVQPNLDMRDAEMLDSALKAAHRSEDPKIFGEKGIEAALGMKGPGVLQPPIPGATIATTVGLDGIDLHASPRTKVFAPADGTVTKVWMDDKMGRSAQIALPNGYTATFSGLGTFNYEAGQRITRGQVLGLSGADDRGQGLTHYAIADSTGKYFDPRSASSAPVDPKNFNTAAQEEKAIEWVNANVADPNAQKLAEGYVRGIANTNRQIMNQEHADAMKQATDWYLEHGRSLSGLPGDVRLKLTPEDIDSFSQVTKARNDPQTELDFMSGKTPLTTDNVKAAWRAGKLSDEGYVHFGGEALKLQNAPPEKIRTVSVDHDQLTDILSLNQFPNLAQPDTVPAGPEREAAQLQRVQLETAIKNEIDRQQQGSNRALSWQEKGKIARDMIVDKVYTSGNAAKDLKPVAILNPDEQNQAHVWVGNQKVKMKDIPSQYTREAMQDIVAHGGAATQAQIAAWWLNKKKQLGQ